MQSLMDLLRELVNKTQRLEQNSQRFDQYYALPLLYKRGGDEWNETGARRPTVPRGYIHSHSPNNILPIS